MRTRPSRVLAAAPRPPAVELSTRRARVVHGGEPIPAFAALRDHLAFYPQRVEACFLDEEQVQANEGGFYGGWITADIGGPFKGGAGTARW